MQKIRNIAAVIVGVCSFNQMAEAYETPASHALIYDYETDVVLFSKQGEEQMIPASMTKIMTAFMVFERLGDGRLKEDDVFTVSEEAWRRGGWASGGSTMGLSIGEQVSISDLLHGVIIQSGNDACIVLAEGISGSEEAFAREMTTRAQELGLFSASFKNATGLYDDEHRISALDLARLAKLTIEKYPDQYTIYNEREFEWNTIRQPNRNPLLYRYDGTDGLKTGHLEASGYGLVASAVEGDRRMIIVINGLQDERARSDEAARIMRSAFREFSVYDGIKQGDVVAKAPVWLGADNSVDLIAAEDVTFGFETAERNNLIARVVLDEGLQAPVTEGVKLGVLTISNETDTLAVVNLHAGQNIQKKGLMSRAFEGFSILIAPPSGS